MKKHFLIILALLFFLGCSYPNTWYKYGTSFEQAQKDWQECRYEATKYANPSNSLSSFPGIKVEEQCMCLRGYYLIDTDKIKVNRLQVHNPFYGQMYNVAGD